VISATAVDFIFCIDKDSSGCNPGANWVLVKDFRALPKEGNTLALLYLLYLFPFVPADNLIFSYFSQINCILPKTRIIGGASYTKTGCIAPRSTNPKPWMASSRHWPNPKIGVWLSGQFIFLFCLSGCLLVHIYLTTRPIAQLIHSTYTIHLHVGIL
jgi:hypothetical protein